MGEFGPPSTAGSFPLEAAGGSHETFSEQHSYHYMCQSREGAFPGQVYDGAEGSKAGGGQVFDIEDSPLASPEFLCYVIAPRRSLPG